MEIEVLASPHEVTERAFAELLAVLGRERRPLVSFATGSTFTAFYDLLARRMRERVVAPDAMLATHLDEYLGLSSEEPGSMVHEILARCPPLRELVRTEGFLAVPSSAGGAAIAEHDARLRRAGGVALQFLGIGRNGHVAFNEPGTPFTAGFHAAELAAVTREDARARFAPREVPHAAVTAGLRDILAARRIVLCACGPAKAEAVRNALEGPVSAACPASAVRLHRNAVFLLDRAAAALLNEAAHPGP